LLIHLKQAGAAPVLRYDPLSPNSDTAEAMKAARLCELVNVGSVENLSADLQAESIS
jgi:hypothetical protein